MSCCGQGRAALRKFQGAAEQAPVVVDKSMTRVLLRYQARTPIAVRGVYTGQVYTFDAERTQQHVELRDAAALLRSRYFVRID